MASISWLVAKLRQDFPAFQLVANDDFHWLPKESTVFYNPSGQSAFLLHELAHGILGHDGYDKDITLIRYECDAWQYAVEQLAKRYDTPIEDATVQDALDTYRDWLHARSICPDCQATGIQIKRQAYSCLACGTQWIVNEARTCGLRRFRLAKQNTLL